MNSSWTNGSAWDRVIYKFGSLFTPENETLDMLPELKGAGRILVLPSDRSGGLILGVPVYQGLRQNYPRAEIVLVSPGHLSTLARQISYVDEVISADLNAGPVWNSPVIRLTRSLRNRGFDLAVCLGSDCSFRLGQVCAQSGARLRVGFSRPEAEDWFNIQIVCKDRNGYEKSQYEVMLNLLGLEGSGDAGWSISQERLRNVRLRYFFGEFASGNVVAIDMSRREGIGMSRQQVGEMVGRLIESGSRAILFFSFAEKRQVDYFKSAYGSRIIAFDLEDLSEVAPLLGGCRALVSCNTDLLHLAVSLQIPAVAIFDEDPQRWIDPENDRVVVVQAEDVQAVSVDEVLDALDQTAKWLRPLPSRPP